MRPNMWRLSFLFVLTATVSSIGPDAIGSGTNKPMKVTIDFGVLCAQVSTPDPGNTDPNATVTLNLPSTCGTASDFYTFAPSGGTPRAEAAPDSQSDVLSLLNVKITRTGNPADLHMTFWANNFEPPPDNSTALTGYKIIGSGNWKTGVLAKAPGSSLIFEGWIDDTGGGLPSSGLHGLGYTPPTSVAVPVAVDGGAGTGTFSGMFAASVWSAGTLGSPRTLKGELWVHLAQSNHSLNLTSLVVQNYQPKVHECQPLQGKLRECRQQQVSTK